MNTSELLSIMSCSFYNLVDNYGVLSKDEISYSMFDFNKNDVITLCVNSLEHSLTPKLGHWYGLMFYNGVVLFFDPLNEPITTYLPKYVLSRINRPIYSVGKRLQGDSVLCGQYCLSFMYFMLVNSFNVKHFINMFSDNLSKNDVKIKQLFNKYFYTCI